MSSPNTNPHTHFQSICHISCPIPLRISLLLPMSSQNTISPAHVLSVHHRSSQVQAAGEYTIISLVMSSKNTIPAVHIQSVHYLFCQCRVHHLSCTCPISTSPCPSLVSKPLHHIWLCPVRIPPSTHVQSVHHLSCPSSVNIPSHLIMCCKNTLSCPCQEMMPCLLPMSSLTR